MQIKIEGVKDHKGFFLESPFISNEKILVLTGRNGSGKSRLIESIGNGCSKVYLDGDVVNSRDIKVVAQNELNPQIGTKYNDVKYKDVVDATLRFYRLIREDLDYPYDPTKRGRHIEHDGGLDYQSLCLLCQSIAKKLNKSASTLNPAEITYYFEEPSKNIFGMQNIATIFNQYIKRKHLNEYNQFLRNVKKADVQCLTDEEFIENFREKPWILANQILRDTFDGKFQFALPDEASQTYSYQTQLIQMDNKAPVLIENLSSGEKTLLWMALTLFNSQYYNPDAIKVPKLILIDEPDAFLHPKMVLKMYQALKSFTDIFSSIVLITTHSPTTVALAPSDGILLVEDNSITMIEQDSAIAELLDGVTQISLDPKNRRQVFVESQYDVDVYQSIFAKLVQISDKIDPKISLTFVSSGPKMPEEHLIGKAKQILNFTNDALLEEFVVAVNGAGDCVRVRGQVEALAKSGSNSVRGIIDWDTRNRSSEAVSVLAEGYAYSIENVTLDPICILLLIHVNVRSLKMIEICGTDLFWRDWLKDTQLLQESVDRFIFKVLGRPNKKDSLLKYVSGIELQGDSEYLTMDGHPLESLVIEHYPDLKKFRKKQKEGEVKCAIVEGAMLMLTNGAFIPSVYEQVFSQVQK